MKSDLLAKSMKWLERVKGIEPSYSAWKAAATAGPNNSHLSLWVPAPVRNCALGGDDVWIDFVRSQTKSPVFRPGFSIPIPIRENRLRGLISHGCVVAVGVGFVGFTVGTGFGLGLGAAARALGELAFDFLDRFGLGRMLHDRDFARQPVERRFIELAFAVGLLGLRLAITTYNCTIAGNMFTFRHIRRSECATRQGPPQSIGMPGHI
jgi:hypothetical protein